MKKQIYKLDLDDFGDDGEDLAYLFFHTTVPGYVFVDDLNHLYELSLRRLDDLPLEGDGWPLYTYRDSLQMVDYYLIERPAGPASTAPHWAPGHKMMILKGEQALNDAEHIIADFSTPLAHPNAGNPAEEERYNILTSYQQAFTPVTLYDINAPAPTSKKVLRERGELEHLLTTIIDLLDLSGIE